MHLAQKYRLKSPCNSIYSLGPFQSICPTAHLQQYDASPEPLQISTALIHRELPAVDVEHTGSLKKPAMNNSKRFSHHRGEDEISQNAEAEFGQSVAIKASELISEGIWYLRRKK
jgi:hypothetical protein